MAGWNGPCTAPAGKRYSPGESRTLERCSMPVTRSHELQDWPGVHIERQQVFVRTDGMPMLYIRA